MDSGRSPGSLPLPSRRDLMKAAVKVAALGCSGVSYTTIARAKAPASVGAGSFSHIDSMLRAATHGGELPGVVALAATDNDIVYEGVFGMRRLHDQPPMTRDTVFRIASMVKLITSVAALQLVEQDKLSLDAPVPD
ncbi:MAG TPA: serine hydrolase domain-containing protein, partial [Xanthobacteraceae bacterium]